MAQKFVAPIGLAAYQVKPIHHGAIIRVSQRRRSDHLAIFPAAWLGGPSGLLFPPLLLLGRGSVAAIGLRRLLSLRLSRLIGLGFLVLSPLPLLLRQHHRPRKAPPSPADAPLNLRRLEIGF